ncbi:MAG: hypothetical protein F9K38_15910 [Pseudorhodoplanes sp.]|nr:MAG: hypothetical protein F9K38_15910 [Pseudorhodoplanes sp.]
MALKDLVAQKSALTEGAIEGIVRDYVRYDAEQREIGFTPKFAELSNKAKILVYLVALQGWPYIVKESAPSDPKPADIGDELGIPGGTLRPLLKDLKERHLIATKAGRYLVRSSSFDAIQKEIAGLGNDGGIASKAKSSRRSKKTKTNQQKVGAISKSSKKVATGGSKEITLKFNKWVETGFFAKGKTLGDVQARFHQEAIIIPQSSIPKYLLRAVRDGRLSRDMQEVNGKRRWVYRSK